MMGAQGVWTGSLWLTVAEAESPPAQKESLLKATSHDTVRSRSWTGKPCRMLRNDWTEAWENPENPKPLGMPLQFMVTADAVSRTNRYAAKAQPVAFNPVGQVVGLMNEEEPVRDVIMHLVEEYLDAVGALRGAPAEGRVGARLARHVLALALPARDDRRRALHLQRVSAASGEQPPRGAELLRGLAHQRARAAPLRLAGRRDVLLRLDGRARRAGRAGWGSPSRSRRGPRCSRWCRWRAAPSADRSGRWWRGSAPAYRSTRGAGRRARCATRSALRRLVNPFHFRHPDVRVVRDLRYADGAGKRHLLDVYVPRGGTSGAPVLLQIHGGAWTIGHKRQQALPLMNHLAARGWVCVAANYRLSPKATFPEHLIDVKLAIRWIREHIAEYGGDPRFLAVTGGSAGGHLTALAALTANDPGVPARLRVGRHARAGRRSVLRSLRLHRPPGARSEARLRPLPRALGDQEEVRGRTATPSSARRR